MAASLSLDSDDEYGYDLTLEDESLLSQLITEAPNPASAPPPPAAVAALAEDLGIDTVAEEEFRLNDAPSNALSYEPSATAKAPLRSRSRRRAAFGTDSRKHRAATPPSNGNGVVNYPDREFATRNGPVFGN